MKTLYIGLGIHKSGTSWLYNQLENHPAIHMLQRDRHLFLFSHRYEKEISRIKENICSNKKTTTQLVEMSNLYFCKPEAMQHIKNSFPFSKHFVILRNPISRIQSHYNQDLRTGKITKDTGIEEAIKMDSSMLSNGKFTLHLGRYLKYFDRSQLFIINFESIKSKPEEVLNSLCKFLDIPPTENMKVVSSKRINSSRSPRSVLLERFQNEIYFTLKRSKLLSPLWYFAKWLGAGKMLRALNSKDAIPVVISDELKAQLNATYDLELQMIAEGKIFNI